MADAGVIAQSGGTVLLWIFFTIGALITAYFVFALLYHWLRFGHMYPWVWVALPVYAIGTAVLFLAMLGALVSI